MRTLRQEHGRAIGRNEVHILVAHRVRERARDRDARAARLDQESLRTSRVVTGAGDTVIGATVGVTNAVTAGGVAVAEGEADVGVGTNAAGPHAPINT